MTAARQPFARYRERLAAAGFRPSRSRGQNFLIDANLHRVIADAVAPAATDLVLEVGPGLGFLTRELAGRGCRVVAVEVDARLARIVAEDLRGSPDAERVELVIHDVLAAVGTGLAPEVERALGAPPRPPSGRFLVVANLPYSITGPFLAAVFRTEVGLPDAMALLVQREVGERLCAPPGGRTYGALPATLRTVFAAELLRRVGSESFRPRPKVESAIVRLSVRPDAPASALDSDRRGEFAEFVRALFSSRRKKLRAGLRAAEARCGGVFRATAAQLERRPEELAPDELFDLWSSGSSGS